MSSSSRRKRRILYLENGRQRYSISRVDLRFSEAGFQVDNYWAYAGDFPTHLDYAGVFISGSPCGAYEDIDWIHQEHEIICNLARKGVPMLGVCFGSQIIASALCGRDQVFRRNRCEVGFKWIQLCRPHGQDELLDGLEDRVYMFVYHNDEVKADHHDMTILGYNEECPNHIWRFRNLPFWGVQGHPELTKEQALLSFQRNRQSFLQDGADIDALCREAHETPEAKKIIKNFMNICKNWP